MPVGQLCFWNTSSERQTDPNLKSNKNQITKSSSSHFYKDLQEDGLSSGLKSAETLVDQPCSCALWLMQHVTIRFVVTTVPVNSVFYWTALPWSGLVQFTDHSKASAVLEQNCINAGHADVRPVPTFSSHKAKLIEIIICQKVDVLLQDPWLRSHVPESQLRSRLK